MPGGVQNHSMSHSISRRHLPLLISAATTVAHAAEEKPAIWDGFPRQDPAWVKEVVGSSHRDLAKVKALVDEHPTLANATIDWGFGDWETAIGAAAHTGRRAIAEYLLEKGARLDMFAAAMLGMTDVVKKMVEARPGVEATCGPHGIPLIAHARAGGDAAKETFAYLQTLPGASTGIPILPFDDEKRKVYAGSYQIENGINARIKLTSPKQLSLEIENDTPRWIHHAGEGEFYPAGAGKVRVRFTWTEDRVTGFSIVDGTRVVRARKVG
jgi:hypothetical protein